MKLFKLEIECDNFEESPCYEIAWILRELSDKLGDKLGDELYPNSAQWLRDVNGNRVGIYKYESH